eukprot:Filipodium_phascolosomae@DN7544_c0_g1_i1.p1
MFLSQLHPHFEIVIFTASRREYANSILAWMEIDTWVDSKLYRESCIHTASGHLKDLRLVREDLAKILIMDDSPISLLLQPENCILVEGWKGNSHDTLLLDLIPFLLALRRTRDVRCLLQMRLFTPQMVQTLAPATTTTT